MSPKIRRGPRSSNQICLVHGPKGSKGSGFRGYIGVYRGIWGLGFRVHVPNNEVLGYWVVVIIVLALGLLGTWTLRVVNSFREGRMHWVPARAGAIYGVKRSGGLSYFEKSASTYL